MTLVGAALTAEAQDLEPRSYSNTPVGIDGTRSYVNFSTQGSTSGLISRKARMF